MYASMGVEQSKRDKMVSVRLTDEEQERLEAVIVTVLARERYAKKADVLRELLGVADTGMIMLEDKLALRAAPRPESVVAARKAPIREVLSKIFEECERLEDEKEKQEIAKQLKELLTDLNALPKKNADPSRAQGANRSR